MEARSAAAVRCDNLQLHLQLHHMQHLQLHLQLYLQLHLPLHLHVGWLGRPVGIGTLKLGRPLGAEMWAGEAKLSSHRGAPTDRRFNATAGYRGLLDFSVGPPRVFRHPSSCYDQDGVLDG